MSGTRTLREKMDLFAFTPVPTGLEVSSSRSRCGTILFMVLFSLYILMVIYNHFAYNLPKVNDFQTSLSDDEIYDAPEVAFAFLMGDNLNISFYNASYFTFTFEQVTVYQDVNQPRSYIDIPMKQCNPNWLQPEVAVYCPENTGELQGLLYGSPVHQFVRMKVHMCFNSTACATNDDINWILMTGRLFVFLKQYPRQDLLSQKLIQDDTPYVSYYYFLTFDQYNRAELKIEAEYMTIRPNMVSTWANKDMLDLQYGDVNFYVSKVPQTKSHDIFLWWCTMYDTTTISTVAYETSLDVVSKIGAMFSVLFAFFALYFLRFNRRNYYNNNTHMRNFDDKISPLVTEAQRLRTQSIVDEQSSGEPRNERPLTNWLQNVVKNPNFEMQKVAATKKATETQNTALQINLVGNEDATQ